MSLYYKLIDFVEGDIDAYDLRRSDYSNVLSVDSITKNRNRSLVSLHFYSSEFLNLIFPEDRSNNNSYILNFLFSTYGGSGNLFVDDYYFNEDEWNNGYIYDYFSDENKKLLYDILLKISPTIAFKINDDNNRNEVFDFLHSNFERYIDDIQSEYASYYDECLQAGAKKYVLYKSCDVLTSYGIFKQNCAKKYLTTIGNIIKLWDNSSISKDINSLLEFLEEFIKENDLYYDEDLWEDYYSYFDYSLFDFEGFNSRVTRYLEQMSDKVDEDYELGYVKKNIELVDLINKLKYKFNVWYSFPKEKNYGDKYDYVFKIDGIDKGKIEVLVKKTGISNLDKLKMNKEDFINFLSHPELFS